MRFKSFKSSLLKKTEHTLVKAYNPFKCKAFSKSYNNWEELSNKRKKLDNFVCVKCGYKPPINERYKLQVHHIIPLSRGGSNTLANLQTLCEGCHSKLHKRDLRYK